MTGPGAVRRGRADAMPCRLKASGFTMLEMVVASIVICVLATVLFERLAIYQEYAEKTAMEVTVRNLRTGLRYQMADRMNRDRMQDMGRLLYDNPVTWMEKPPPNYLGVLNNPAIEQITPGNWYFDAAQHLMVYMPKRHRFLTYANPADTTMRFRVTALKGPPKPVQSSAPDVELLSLTLLNNYQWDWPR